MAKSTKTFTERIAEHPMYSRSDLKYLRNKGYTDPEILAFWERDHKMGCTPVPHRDRPLRKPVPAREDPTEPGKELRDLMQDCMSPLAVATIIAFLQPAQTKNSDVNRQVDWFRDQLVELVGGDKAFGDLCSEVGL